MLKPAPKEMVGSLTGKQSLTSLTLNKVSRTFSLEREQSLTRALCLLASHPGHSCRIRYREYCSKPRKLRRSKRFSSASFRTSRIYQRRPSSLDHFPTTLELHRNLPLLLDPLRLLPEHPTNSFRNSQLARYQVHRQILSSPFSSYHSSRRDRP